MPLFGGSPGGTSSGNTSSYSCKISKTALGKVDGKLLVIKRLSLHMSMKNMAFGSLKFFRSPSEPSSLIPVFPLFWIFVAVEFYLALDSLSHLLCWIHSSVSHSHYFLLRSSFIISSGVKESKEMRSPLYRKTTLLGRPQICASRSYNQGLPKSSWHACIGTTSQSN